MIQEFTRKYNEKFYLYYIIVYRNGERGEVIKHKVEKQKNVEVSLVEMDIGKVDSVMKGTAAIKKKFGRIDGLYLNAGIMPVQSIRWGYFAKSLFNGDVFKIMFNGEGLFEHRDVTNADGHREIFATNVLGHFLIVRELRDNLEQRTSKDSVAKIVWTSSMSSSRKFFDINDVMCIQGSEPYSSSKYSVDAVALAWNDEFQEKHDPPRVKSVTVDPGTVLTGLMAQFLPFWFLYIFLAPIFFVLRLFNTSNNVFPINASPAFIHAFDDATLIEPEIKFCSSTTFSRKNYVRNIPLEVAKPEARAIFKEIKRIADTATKNYS